MAQDTTVFSKSMCICEGLSVHACDGRFVRGVSVEGDCFLQILTTPRDSQGLSLRRHLSLVRWDVG